MGYSKSTISATRQLCITTGYAIHWTQRWELGSSITNKSIEGRSTYKNNNEKIAAKTL